MMSPQLLRLFGLLPPRGAPSQAKEDKQAVFARSLRCSQHIDGSGIQAARGAGAHADQAAGA
jgi:hypothetical protein